MSGVHSRPLFDLMDLAPPEPMQHCLGPEHLDRYWCGAPRDANRRIQFARRPLDCVVCQDLIKSNGPWWLCERGL